jgi:hypothetical protein
VITSTVKTHDQLGRIDELLDRKTTSALNTAARAAAAVADERAHTEAGKQISTFQVIPAHGTANGFASGIKGRNPLWRVYDKGTLGKRRAQLKGRNRRKTSWTVKRNGSEYEAHRNPDALNGKGISARNISNAARTAGRKALITSLRR